MKVKELRFWRLVSFHTIGVLLTCLLSGCLCKDSDDAYKLYANQGEKANLVCRLNFTNLQYSSETGLPVLWSFQSLNQPLDNNDSSVMDLKEKCQQVETEKDEINQQKSCTLRYDTNKNDSIASVLRIHKVSDADYGSYTCFLNLGDGSIKRNLELRDLVSVTRKTSSKTRESSTIVNVGEVLYLYCNYTNLRDDHIIQWSRKTPDSDETKISFRNESDPLFQNFTLIENMTEFSGYKGIASFEHRGEYTCDVQLKNESESSLHSKNFSRKAFSYTFNVRIRESNRWMIPGLILIGEVLFLGIFTFFISRRADNKEEVVDGDFADSSDEEDDPKKEN